MKLHGDLGISHNAAWRMKHTLMQKEIIVRSSLGLSNWMMLILAANVLRTSVAAVRPIKRLWSQPRRLQAIAIQLNLSFGWKKGSGHRKLSHGVSNIEVKEIPLFRMAYLALRRLLRLVALVIKLSVVVGVPRLKNLSSIGKTRFLGI